MIKKLLIITFLTLTFSLTHNVFAWHFLYVESDHYEMLKNAEQMKSWFEDIDEKDINTPLDDYGVTALHLAIGCIVFNDKVEKLLTRGANPNIKDSSGDTPLHYAAYQGNAAVVELLLKRGADVHAVDNAGMTPLFVICCYQRYIKERVKDITPVMQLLIDYGAQVNAKNPSSNYYPTPLHHAVGGSAASVKLLLQHKADSNAQNEYGETTFQCAAQHCKYAKDITKEISLLKTMLDNGANINAQDKEGNTALHMLLSEFAHCPAWCSVHNHNTNNNIRYIVKFLLKHGADKTIKNHKGETPFYVAYRKDDHVSAKRISNQNGFMRFYTYYTHKLFTKKQTNKKTTCHHHVTHH